jgi:hypothetical protein
MAAQIALVCEGATAAYFAGLPLHLLQLVCNAALAFSSVTSREGRKSAQAIQRASGALAFGASSRWEIVDAAGRASLYRVLDAGAGRVHDAGLILLWAVSGPLAEPIRQRPVARFEAEAADLGPLIIILRTAQ